MSISIREFADSDYAVAIEIANALRPHSPRIEGEMRFMDEHRDTRCKQRRWVVEENGTVVAWGQYQQHLEDYHPRKFNLDVAVRPDRQGQGIGSVLYEHVVASLEPLAPIGLTCWAREDETRSVRFLTNRGYTENMRVWTSRLDLTAFDPAAFDEDVAKVRESGIAIKSLTELEGNEDYVQRLMDVEHLIEIDVPSENKPLMPTVEQFKATRMASPALLPDVYLVAVADGEYVGMSNLWKHDPNDPNTFLATGLTGVRREYRRRGIALAMKVHALRWCKEQGYREVRTENEVNNPMFTINERLGFVKDPAWIQFAKVLGTE